MEQKINELNNVRKLATIARILDIQPIEGADNIETVVVRGWRCVAKKGEFKGIIMYFNTKEGKPFYLYKPLELLIYNEIDVWEEKMIEKYESEEHNMLWIKNHYWKLEKLSCVLVLRNKTWFNNNIQAIENVWNIIEKERVTGYDHRAPVKKIRKDSFGSSSDIESTGCLIKINHG
jgi:hypothetical protein